MYRVRLLALAAEAEAHGAALYDVTATAALRLAAAVGLRRRLGLPTAGVTDVYRLVNAEGDRLSGLVVDAFADTLVAQCTASWAQQRRAPLARALLEASGAARVLWRPVPDLLKLEGVESCESPELFCGAPFRTIPLADAADQLPERLEVRENGVRYNVNLRTGQKTGFYADQREQRLRIRALARGARVLDVCCYSGGFAVSAALGGALSVVGVDSSGAALELARANAALNGVAGVCSFIEDDMLGALRSHAPNSFDLIILDPPKLAPSKGALPKAAGLYRRLNAAAALLLAPGGILLTCSCSGAMTQSGTFPALVAEAAGAAGRSVALLAVAGAAPCHARAAGHAESEYLTAVTLGLT